MNHRSLLLCSFLVCFVLPCHPTTTRDIITSSGNGFLKHGETIVSAGKSFELGFFPPQGNGGRYVGIWYYERYPRTIVWVANRDNPCSDSPGTILAIQDGNLTVSSPNGDSCFSVGHPSTPRSFNRTAQLLDSGNLVFRDESGKILWQSFDHPTDTFLPGMKMTPGLKLVSWNQNQPGTGNYTFQVDKGTDQYTISKEQSAEPFWKSGDPLASSVVEEVTFLLSNFSRTVLSKKSSSNHIRTLNFPSLSSFNDTTNYKDTRLLMSPSGEIQFYVWDNNEKTWNLPWKVPQDNCSVYNFCGNFGICSRNNTESPCKCLDGFDPKYPGDWKAGRYSGGCARKSEASCNQNITFLNLTSMKVDYPYPPPNSMTNEEQCGKECLDDCDCQAYSFGGEQRGEDRCRIWTAELNDLQDYYDHGFKLSVRVADIELQAQGSSRERKEATAVLKSLAIYILGVVAFVLLCSLGCIVYKRKLAGNRREIILGMPNIGMQEQDLITEYDKRKIEVPFFSLRAILAATDNFSDANKLGQGGFGPVYKGNFPGGQTIAVKRLLSNCGQGVDEFKNETWKLWMEEMAIEIVEPVVLNSLSRSEILKCIHIGLLCVQEDPSDRPTMTDVVIMLVTESMALPRPNQPAFVARKRLSAISSSSSSSKPNQLTVTMLEGR
nr:G-type lectin S-receptor-like serine/threonine-protein kinase At4g03230 isoform X1 [Ipomoea batatas]